MLFVLYSISAVFQVLQLGPCTMFIDVILALVDCSSHQADDEVNWHVFDSADDPEGSFVPPEFDNTGSTFEVRYPERCHLLI